VSGTRLFAPSDSGSDHAAVYLVLKEVVERGEVITYGELSNRYEEKTGTRIHWRNWAPALDRVGAWSCRLGLPTIAAVVVNGQLGMPGDRFFGRSRASRSVKRERWQKLLGRVYNAAWPETME
jgi:hypothetical protein